MQSHAWAALQHSTCLQCMLHAPQVMAKRGKLRFCGCRIDIMAAVFTLLVTWAFTGSIVVRAIYRLTHGTYHVNADVMLGVAVSSPSPRTPQTPSPFLPPFACARTQALTPAMLGTLHCRTRTRALPAGCL